MRVMISIAVVLCSSVLASGVQVDQLKVEKKVQQESVLDKVHNVLVAKHTKTLSLIQNMKKDNARSKVYNEKVQKELQDFWSKARDEGKRAGQAYEEYQEVKRKAALAEALLEEDEDMFQKAQELLDKEQEKILQPMQQEAPQKTKPLHLKKAALNQESSVEALQNQVKRLEAENAELRQEVAAEYGPEDFAVDMHHQAIKAGQEAKRAKENFDQEKWAAQLAQAQAPIPKKGYHYNPYLEKVKDVSGTAFATVAQLKKEFQDTIDFHGNKMQELKESEANKRQQWEKMDQMEKVKELWSDKKVITDTGRFAQELQKRHRTSVKPALSSVGVWSTPKATEE